MERSLFFIDRKNEKELVLSIRKWYDYTRLEKINHQIMWQSINDFASELSFWVFCSIHCLVSQLSGAAGRRG